MHPDFDDNDGAIEIGVNPATGSKTRATIEVHHCFSEAPPFGSLRPLLKNDLR